MPTKNSFSHQRYSAKPPQGRYELLDASFPPQPGTDKYDDLVSQAGKRVAANVDAIYLIHGTFVGNDILGWTEQLEKFWPQSVEYLRTLSKKLVDAVADDNGNFTEQYAEQLRTIIRPFAAEFPVRLFNWSGENNHVARCVAAIELMDCLIRRSEDEPRALLLCHSHAGNVLAIVSSLLGVQSEARDRFFKILRPVFRGKNEVEQLQRVEEALVTKRLQNSLSLDIVTLGTPIRYDWNGAGYRRLLHFVHHQPRKGVPEYLSPLPNSARGMMELRGDFVQQFGIAGTNILPYLFDLPLQVTEQKLNGLLQPFGRSQFWDNLKIGMRVAQQGTTLLVKYEDAFGLARKLAGHGIYTQCEWLPFHLPELARRFYE